MENKSREKFIRVNEKELQDYIAVKTLAYDNYELLRTLSNEKIKEFIQAHKNVIKTPELERIFEATRIIPNEMEFYNKRMATSNLNALAKMYKTEFGTILIKQEEFNKYGTPSLVENKRLHPIETQSQIIEDITGLSAQQEIEDSTELPTEEVINDSPTNNSINGDNNPVMNNNVLSPNNLQEQQIDIKTYIEIKQLAYAKQKEFNSIIDINLFQKKLKEFINLNPILSKNVELGKIFTATIVFPDDKTFINDLFTLIRQGEKDIVNKLAEKYQVNIAVIYTKLFEIDNYQLNNLINDGVLKSERRNQDEDDYFFDLVNKQRDKIIAEDKNHGKIIEGNFGGYTGRKR